MIGLVGFVLGVLLFVVLAVIEYSAWALVVPPRLRKNKEDFVDSPTLSESITAVARDGVRLAGIWYPAIGNATGQTVLLLHGFAEASAATASDAQSRH